MWVYVCVSVSECVCESVCAGAGTHGQQDVSGLILQEAVSHLRESWDTNSGPLKEQEVPLSTEPPLLYVNLFLYVFFKLHFGTKSIQVPGI